MLSGAEIMVRCLKEEGVSLIFGYPGAAICPFYDKLYNAGIRHVLVRSEQNAAHAASGYARMGGKIGVCCATSGPGATNLITGIAAAYMDSVPLVAITGQVSRRDLGKDVFQEADVTGACESFVKHSYLVDSAADLPRVFKEAFHIAATGRPGPVLIDVPVDVQEERTASFSYPQKADILGYKPKGQGHGLQIKKALEAIAQAKRPLLCCGGGVVASRAEKALNALSQRANLPVISTMMGLGAMPAGCSRHLGMMGSYGTANANRALQQCDLLLLCGARVADRAIAQPEKIGAKIIHIDIDPAEIGKNIRADIPIVGDLNHVLAALLEKVGQKPGWFTPVNEVPQRLETRPDRVDPGAFIRALSAQMEGGDALLPDVGQGLIWCAANYDKGRFFTSGGLGAMGYALPAAIGAKLARPGSQVVAVCGDGAFQMSMCELATAVNIPIKIVVMDNGRLGMVRELQNQQYGGRHMATHMGGNPDFAAIARAYGMKADCAANTEEAVAFIPQLLAHKGPCLLVCRVSAETPSLASSGGLSQAARGGEDR